MRYTSGFEPMHRLTAAFHFRESEHAAARTSSCRAIVPWVHFSRREHRCRSRTLQTWLRWFNSTFAWRYGLQTLIVKSRLLTGENSVRFRGNPPFCRRGSAAPGVCARPRRFRAKRIGGTQVLSPSAPFRIRGEIIIILRFERRVCRWESCRMHHVYAALVQLQETLRLERRGWGWKSLTRHHFAHVVQCRDGALKTRTVSVRVRPWAPGGRAQAPRVAQCRGVPLKTERLQVQVLPRGPICLNRNRALVILVRR